MGGLQKLRILYHSLPRIAKSYITVMSLFFSCHSLSWVCSVLQAALNIFVHVLLYMCRCLCLQCRTRTIWAHFKTHRSSPWAPGPCVTVTTEWHNTMWKNRNLQIRCTEVDLSSQFCWHRRTWEEDWASQHRHQQNSENMWRIALGLTHLAHISCTGALSKITSLTFSITKPMLAFQSETREIPSPEPNPQVWTQAALEWLLSPDVSSCSQ